MAISDRLVRDVKILMLLAVGLAFMAGGGYGVYSSLHEHPINVKLVWTFVAVTVFGALLLPSVFDVAFPRAKAIYFLIFPNGLPVIGGRRAGDPPGPPPSAGDKP